MGIAVGIDLGTSNSCVAVMRDGRPVVLADAQGRRTQPSVVAFGHGRSVVVGHDAHRQLVYAPQSTVASTKRLIGRRFTSDQVRRVRDSAAYAIEEGPHGDPRVRIQGRTLSLPEISAYVLRHMRRIAEEATGEVVDKAVITVPAYFNDAQRQATRDAARIAGLEVLRILNEPTAAAMAYGVGRDVRHHLAVYDLGGGTFDISVLLLEGEVYEVVATAGDTFLGGDDFDAALAQWLQERFQSSTGMDITNDRTARLKLRQAAERTKILLSSAMEVEVEVPGLARDGLGREVGLSTRLNRLQYAEIVLPIVQRTFLTCDDALSQAGMTASQMDHVLLVGGMTRYPLIQEAVAQYFGQKPFAGINPDEVVALGAAVQAWNLTHADESRSVLLDVTPQSLGIQTVGGFCQVVIPRNTSIPAALSKVFHTAHDNQTDVRIAVFQGESRMAADNEALGQFVLGGLRPAPRGELHVKVSFEIDVNGIVNVLAEDEETGAVEGLRLEASSGLTEEEVRSLTFEDLDF